MITLNKTKIRSFPEFNYHAIWHNFQTIRFGINDSFELPPNYSEFYDVSLGTKCNLGCDFCYTNASNLGKNYTNICQKAKQFFGNMSKEQKPFQIACSSQGECTIHPEFLDFIKTIHDLDIVPNYTTNGITLANDDSYSKKLLNTTKKYCGAVAISTNGFNDKIENIWQKAAKKVLDKGIKLNLHTIISNKASVDRFLTIYSKYKDDVHYFVLLPLMAIGRAKKGYDEEAFDYLLQQDLDWRKISFGAHFYEKLKNQDKVKCWLYPPESFSKNLILDDVIKITPSSFDLTPLMEIIYGNIHE